MKTTKKILCAALAMLMLLSFMPIMSAAAAEPGEVPFTAAGPLSTILVEKVVRILAGGMPNDSGFRFYSLVIIDYTTHQSNYRIRANRVAVNADNALEVFAEGYYIGDAGAMVMGRGLLVLYVPLRKVSGTSGVKVTFET